MDFDLRTCDDAYKFVLEFMKMRPDEYIMDLIVDCDNEFEKFWDKHYGFINTVDISGLKLYAFHILASLDNCNEIRENGLRSLQEVLTTDTLLARLLKEYGIIFDVNNHSLNCNGKTYKIDYDYYRNKTRLTDKEEALSSIAHRVFYDYCVNGFFLNDDVFDYGGRVHERPEFLEVLSKVFTQLKDLVTYWKQNSRSYRIDFFSTIDQLHRFTFELDERRNPPYEGWLELDDNMKIKKWMLSHAIDRANGGLTEEYIYIMDNLCIHPSQFVSITEINPAVSLR